MFPFFLLILLISSVCWNNVKCELDEDVLSIVNSPIALILLRESDSPVQTDSFGNNGRRFYDSKIDYENFGIDPMASDLDIGSSNSNVNMNINRNDGPGLSWHKSSSKTTKGKKHWKKHHSKSHRDHARQMRQIFQLMHHRQLPTSNIDWNWSNPGRHSPVKRKRIPRHWHSRARRSGLSAVEDDDQDDVEDDLSQENTCDKLLSKILDGVRDIKDSFASLENEVIESIDDL